MERLFLVGVVVCLGISWFYIILLKAKVRDCMAYIQNRIDAANRSLESPQGSPEDPYDSKQPGNSWRPGREKAAGPDRGEATMDRKPKLIVGGANSPQPLHYLCSHCLKPFYLRGNQSPKEAVAELLQEFGEHVEREHPDLVCDSKASPAEADQQDETAGT